MDVESFLSSSVTRNTVCSCALYAEEFMKNPLLHYRTYKEKKKTCNLITHAHHVPAVFLCLHSYTGRPTYKQWATLRAAGARPCAPCQPPCALWYSQNRLAKEPPQEPLLLQKCILLIFEHCGSLESNFSIHSPCVYTENYSFDYRKLHLHKSVRENEPVNSIIKPEDRRNILLLYCDLWHNTCFETNNLLWFKPSQQLSPTQPLAHSHLVGWGRKGASYSTLGKFFCPPVHQQNLWEGRRQGERD